MPAERQGLYVVGFWVWCFLTCPGAKQKWPHCKHEFSPNACFLRSLRATAGDTLAESIGLPQCFQLFHAHEVTPGLQHPHREENQPWGHTQTRDQYPAPVEVAGLFSLPLEESAPWHKPLTTHSITTTINYQLSHSLATALVLPKPT